VGTRVQLRIKGVPRTLVEARDPQHPLVVYGLLQHEHKQSVLHFAVQRNTEYEAPVRAKVSNCGQTEAIVVTDSAFPHSHRTPSFCVSDHDDTESTRSTRNTREAVARVSTMFTSRSDICGMELPSSRLPTDRSCSASNRVCCSVNRRISSVSCKTRGIRCFQSDNASLPGPHLVAMGSFMSADPTRIVAKRIILTGHPFKVHRKTATVRYMFFNRGEWGQLPAKAD
jgi:pre-rRNA-processing protein TSR1